MRMSVSSIIQLLCGVHLIYVSVIRWRLGEIRSPTVVITRLAVPATRSNSWPRLKRESWAYTSYVASPNPSTVLLSFSIKFFEFGVLKQAPFYIARARCGYSLLKEAWKILRIFFIGFALVVFIETSKPVLPAKINFSPLRLRLPTQARFCAEMA